MEDATLQIELPGRQVGDGLPEAQAESLIFLDLECPVRLYLEDGRQIDLDGVPESVLQRIREELYCLGRLHVDD